MTLKKNNNLQVVLLKQKKPRKTVNLMLLHSIKNTMSETNTIKESKEDLNQS
jgi:tRNA pseudouridine-54 N-methylase